MAGFRKMISWQKADDFAVRIYELSRAFPEDERDGLSSQIRRVTVSIPANIAEGAGRQTLKDFCQFLFVARGSLSETEYYLHLAGRLGYITHGQLDELSRLRHEVGSTLQGLINWASKEIKAGRRDLLKKNSGLLVTGLQASFEE